MKHSIYYLIILLVGILYLNGNIFFNNPLESYREYRTDSSINGIIKKYRNQKTTHSVVIDSKAEILSDVTNSTKLTAIQKRNITTAIIKIKIIVVSLKDEKYTALTNLRGLYVRSSRYHTHFIIIDESIINDPSARYTILHELYHLIDDQMVKGAGMYSDNNIVRILDPKLDSIRLRLKINNLLSFYSVFAGPNKKIPKSHEVVEIQESINRYILSDIKYTSSRSEVYARLRVARKYLYDHGRIKYIDQDLTNSDFIYLFSPNIMSNGPQFFELLFFLNNDIGTYYIQMNDLAAINAVP